MKTEDFTKTEIEQKEEKEKIIEINFFKHIFLPLVFVGMLWVFDMAVFQHFIIMNVFIKSDCNYEVPKGYEILTDGKYFIVKCSKDQYLSVGWDMIEPEYPDITKPTKLVSECKAKGYLKRYLKVKNPVKNFKPISETYMQNGTIKMVYVGGPMTDNEAKVLYDTLAAYIEDPEAFIEKIRLKYKPDTLYMHLP